MPAHVGTSHTVRGIQYVLYDRHQCPCASSLDESSSPGISVCRLMCVTFVNSMFTYPLIR
jgi:hypothetical protein